MSSFRSVVNRHDVICPLKPKIPFINEYPTLEATSLLTIHFKLLNLRTCRLSVHLINRPKGHSLFPPSLLLPPCDLCSTRALTLQPFFTSDSDKGRCMNLTGPDNGDAPPTLLQLRQVLLFCFRSALGYSSSYSPLACSSRFSQVIHFLL